MTPDEKVKPKHETLACGCVVDTDTGFISSCCDRCEATAPEKVKPKCHKCGGRAMEEPDIDGRHWCSYCAERTVHGHLSEPEKVTPKRCRTCAHDIDGRACERKDGAYCILHDYAYWEAGE